ncbi:MAG: dihydropteroate synthase [Thermoleophilia bacterium]|nr:dihydropteroate synthase [Thermoleophilia bacterium]
MGVVNVTPDSFSDGGDNMAANAARVTVDRMAADGAAIVDVGAESTRPGAERVPPGEQLRRLDPLLADLYARPPATAVSIDTTHAAVAAAALDAGAVLVNDVSAGREDPELLPLAADRGAAVCLMHMLGQPKDMQERPRYGDVVAEVLAFLEERMAAAVAAGVAEDRILLDPGIGFGKTLEHNLALMAALPELARLGRPVVVGASRKGMIGLLTGRPVEGRLAGSLGAALAAVAGGAAVVRVHDVAQTVDALRVWTAATGAGRA